MVLSGISQYAIVLHSIVGYCIGCTVLYGIEGYFIVLHHVASYQMVLPSIVTQYCRVIEYGIWNMEYLLEGKPK